MRAGRLRHPVVIERPTRGQQPDGSIVHGWAKFADAYLGFRQTGGGQFSQGKQEHERGVYQAEIRHIDDLTPDMRVRFGERVFNIDSVNDFEGRGDQILLTLVEER